MFKGKLSIPVLTLPKHANQRHLYLTLPNCGDYIHQILEFPLTFPQFRNPSMSQLLPASHDTSTGDAQKASILFAQRYFRLAEKEASIEASLNGPLLLDPASTGKCLQISKNIIGYIKAIGDSYNSNPEQMSVMLLNIMDLWVLMDQWAITMYPLLKHYHPVFFPNMLEYVFYLLPSSCPGIDTDLHLGSCSSHVLMISKEYNTFANIWMIEWRHLKNLTQSLMTLQKVALLNATTTSHLNQICSSPAIKPSSVLLKFRRLKRRPNGKPNVCVLLRSAPHLSPGTMPFTCSHLLL
jgi:hypothetical protein